jgi:hypothetical protein
MARGVKRLCWLMVVGIAVGCAAKPRASLERPTSVAAATPAAPPTLRLFALSDVGGALEPCGCQADMLGGVGPAAATIASARAGIGASLTVAAGPLLFPEPVVPDPRRTQDLWKAEALAGSLPELDLVAFAPGGNDWAGGAEELDRLVTRTRALPLAANLHAAGLLLSPTRIVERGGIRIGLAGVSLPESAGALPPGVTASDPTATLAKAVAELERAGATVRVALLALPRRDALALLERVPGFHVAVLGGPVSTIADTATTPPVILGQTLVVAPANHLQGVAVIDFYLVPGDATVRDGTGITAAAQRDQLDHRIAELDRRLETGRAAGAAEADLAARAVEVTELRAERAALAPAARPPEGSYFRYEIREIRAGAGTSPRARDRVTEYYRRVNEHNRVALADRAPPPDPPDAYATLVARETQFNLDCVGCHVTGYEAPGGAAVVQLRGLEGMQCENCHGPGALHSAAPATPGLITLTPPRTLCASRCHHPPHVPATWSVDAAWPHTIGPGHGLPEPDEDDLESSDADGGEGPSP